MQVLLGKSSPIFKSKYGYHLCLTVYVIIFSAARFQLAEPRSWQSFVVTVTTNFHEFNKNSSNSKLLLPQNSDSFSSKLLKALNLQPLHYLALLSISIAQHQHCFALALALLCISISLLSISIAQLQHCLALALLSIGIAQH